VAVGCAEPHRTEWERILQLEVSSTDDADLTS
jgi:hypothetical protein